MIRKLPIALFVLILLHPAVAAMLGFGEIYPLQENRVLAQRPTASDYFNESKLDFLGYTSGLNKWFSEQFPLRAAWVRVRTQLLYSLFSESDRIHIGEDNWLFYRSLLDRELPSLEAPGVAEYRRDFVGKLARLSDLLAREGMRLYVLPFPTKDRFFPEHLPASAMHALKFHFHDDLMNDLLANSTIHTIDNRPILENASRAGLKIYHQTDFHWTDPAAVEVFKPLLTALGETAGIADLGSRWQHEPVTVSDFSGGEAYAMPLLLTPTETTVDVRLISPATRFEHRDVPGLESTRIATSGQGVPLPPLLVFGDSFFDAADRTGFLNYFQGTARGRLYGQELVDVYRNRLPGTQLVILEFVTPGAYGMYNNVTALLEALEANPQL